MKDETWRTNKAQNKTKKSDEPIIIKKYANRRLYNTALSSYITLDDLAAMVRSGQDFIVQDAKTGADLTRSVLTQIIFEQESRGGPLMPVSFLRQLIRMYGDTLQGYVPGYLEMAMTAFEHNQENFRSQMERSFGSAPGYNQLDSMVRANIEMFRKTADMFAPFSAVTPPSSTAKPVQTEEDPEEAEQKASETELDELRQQLAEMQKRMDGLSGKNNS